MDQTGQQDRRIVVGIDGSPGSVAALRWAVQQAQLSDASVEAVSTWQEPAAYGFTYSATPAMFDSTSIATITEKILQETIASVADHSDGPVKITTKVVHGPAALALLDTSVDAQLLVVGSRGHGAFAGMLLGSVSQHCVQHATCPVVVVPSSHETPAPRHGGPTAEPSRRG